MTLVGANIQNDESNLTRISYIPVSAHPSASTSHTQAYYYNGGVDPHGWYILPPSGSPVRLLMTTDPVGATILSDLTDVSLTSPATGQSLVYNGTDWANLRLPVVHIAASSDPTGSENAAAGYPDGSLWLRQDYDFLPIYIKKSESAGVASWSALPMDSEVLHTKSLHTDTVDPDASKDFNNGYRVNQFWYNSASGAVFICIDHTNSAAVWVRIGQQFSLHASDPGAADDAAHGFTSGSQWWNTGTQILYQCVDATTSAAIWKQVTPFVGATDMSHTFTAGTPTAAEISAILGSPTIVPTYAYIADPANSANYQLFWDGTNWWYNALTQAL